MLYLNLAGVRGRVYMELAVEILSGGTGGRTKAAKPVKDAKAGKAGGKDGKTPAGGAGGAAGGTPEDDKGKPVAPEVLPVESPPVVRRSTHLNSSPMIELFNSMIRYDVVYRYC